MAVSNPRIKANQGRESGPSTRIPWYLPEKRPHPPGWHYFVRGSGDIGAGPEASTSRILSYDQDMVTTKEAVTAAMTGLASYFEGFTDFRLEEIDQEAPSRVLITVSAIPPLPTGSTINLSALFKVEDRRVYKLVTIDAETGSVKNIKIRKVQ